MSNNESSIRTILFD